MNRYVNADELLRDIASEIEETEGVIRARPDDPSRREWEIQLGELEWARKLVMRKARPNRDPDDSSMGDAA